MPSFTRVSQPPAPTRAVVREARTGRRASESRPLEPSPAPPPGRGHSIERIPIAPPIPSAPGPAPVQRAVPAGPGPSAIAPSGGGRALPPEVAEPMGRALGGDLSSVRIHEGPQAAKIGAVAFTRGSHVFFQPGRYRPETAEGRQLLGHELAHVVQQRQGRVAVPQGKGLPINADPALESEADAAGERAAREVERAGRGRGTRRGAASGTVGAPRGPASGEVAAGPAQRRAVQRQPDDEDRQQVGKTGIQEGLGRLPRVGGPLGVLTGAAGAPENVRQVRGGNPFGVVSGLTGLASLGLGAFGLMRGRPQVTRMAAGALSTQLGTLSSISGIGAGQLEKKRRQQNG